MEKRRLSGLAAVIVQLPLMVTPCQARAVTPCNAGDLASRADVVVAARVAGIQAAGDAVIDDHAEKVPAEIRDALLRVDHFLKGGQGENRVTLRFLVPSLPMAYLAPQDGTYGIFFLKRDGEHLIPVRNHCLSVAAVPGVRAVGETVLDRILFELAAVLRSKTASVADKRSAIWELRSQKGPLAAKAIMGAAADTNPEVRWEAVAGLIALKDYSRMEAAVEALLHPPPDVSGAPLRNIAYAIGAFVDDPKMIPALLRIAGSGDAIVRRAAIAALGKTHSRLAIPALARALDDVDSATRLAAVRGLSFIFGDAVRPSQMEFAADEERYIEHFRALVGER